MLTNKIHLTILIPTISNIEKSPIVESYINSNIDDFYVQFVFLINSKKTIDTPFGKIQKNDNYEIVKIHNDRYFGSCEENIYRAQDFCDLFKDYIFCIGDNDQIEWDVLVSAIDFFINGNLDAMGWNIKCKQKKQNGEYSEQLAIVPLNLSSTANKYCNILLGKEIIGSCIAYPALISCYGPIDWAAYIGNHLFRKEIFKRVLQYKFSEYVYSFVYKQIRFFTSSNVRYGFYPTPPIHRISCDFLNLKKPNPSAGWLEDHRLVKGQSKCFHISNSQHINEIKNTYIFDLVSNSICLSHAPDANEGIRFVQPGMLTNILSFCKNVILYKLNGKSFYFPDLLHSSSLDDIHTSYEYINRLSNNSKIIANTYLNFPDSFKCHLTLISNLLNQYLSGPASDSLLKYALFEFDKCIKIINQDHILSMNEVSFTNYLNNMQDI